MIDGQTALQEHLLDIATAQGVAQILGDSLHDQASLDMPAPEVTASFPLQLEGERVDDHGPAPRTQRHAGLGWPTTREPRRTHVCDKPVVEALDDHMRRMIRRRTTTGRRLMTRYPRRRRTMTATLVRTLEEPATAVAGTGFKGAAEAEVARAAAPTTAASATAIVGKRKGVILSCRR